MLLFFSKSDLSQVESFVSFVRSITLQFPFLNGEKLQYKFYNCNIFRRPLLQT